MTTDGERRPDGEEETPVASGADASPPSAPGETATPAKSVGKESSPEPPADGAAAEEEIPLPELVCCRFRVGGQEFHIPIESLVEIADMEQVTPVPLAPPYVVGLVNIRGEVAPLVDLGVIRGAASTWSGERRTVVAEAGRERIAFVADGMPDLSDAIGGEPVDVRDFLMRYRVALN